MPEEIKLAIKNNCLPIFSSIDTTLLYLDFEGKAMNPINTEEYLSNIYLKI